ncbi:pyruvate kinase [Bradyrhizobium huanghuaihaiense]|uniref:pyruvate kinase n=1 Tax=Bradyrhizobium huanghuaihaiense TaxID=990078 RepID=UPI003CC66F18
MPSTAVRNARLCSLRLDRSQSSDRGHVASLASRAKILATVGPASAEPERIRALYLSGVDIFRLNVSHGTHEDHAKSYVCSRRSRR